MGAEIITNLMFPYIDIYYVFLVYGTSNEPQNDIGNYLGPCSSFLSWALGSRLGRGRDIETPGIRAHSWGQCS